VKTKVLSKGFYYNLRPFEKQSGGFKQGEILKELPLKTNDVYVYSFDENNRIIIVEKYGKTENIVDYEFCYYKEGEVITYYYASGGSQLRNIKLSIFENGLTKVVYNYAKFGIAKDYYNYKDGGLMNIENFTKEHSKADFKSAKTEFLFENNGHLLSVCKIFDNGFKKELYPEMS
jgi:hypothetical protein